MNEVSLNHGCLLYNLISRIVEACIFPVPLPNKHLRPRDVSQNFFCYLYCFNIFNRTFQISQSTRLKIHYIRSPNSLGTGLSITVLRYSLPLLIQSCPTIFTRLVILLFSAENSRLKVKRHCNGPKTSKRVDKGIALSNNQYKQ